MTVDSSSPTWPARCESTAYPPISAQSIILSGPTASGKSRIALQLASVLNAEILSLDSIAVYKGMDIGTAKATPAERACVAHHLIDLVEPTGDFSVAQFLDAAHQCVADIVARGKRPLFVGGTPMYLKGLLFGFDPGPAADWDFRRSVEQDLDQFGAEALHQRLQQVDPLTAHRVPATDVRRITRALEVAYLTGVPLSHRQTQFERIAADQPTATLVSISWPRELLHQRIEHRVNQMFQNGLIDEVRGLLATYQTLSRTAAAAVGYREVLEHLDDKLSLDETFNQVLYHTRQLARRQETWLRSLPVQHSLTLKDESDLAQCSQSLQSTLERTI